MKWNCQPPSKVLPAIVHPTKCCTQHTYNNVVQPQIHPSHTTTVNHTNIQNQHYYPQTQSVENVTTSQDYNMGPSVAGAYMPGPGPGQVAGAYTPGPGPGQVAGAYMPGPGVAGAYKPGYKKGCWR
ncbi:MAG: CotD family spore coat protein [Bacillota bacterium]